MKKKLLVASLSMLLLCGCGGGSFKETSLDDAKATLQANLEKEPNYTSCHIKTTVSDVKIDIAEIILNAMNKTKEQLEADLRADAKEGERDDTDVDGYKFTIDNLNADKLPEGTKFYKKGNKLKLEAKVTSNSEGMNIQMEATYIINEYGYIEEMNEYVVTSMDESLGMKYYVSARSKIVITYKSEPSSFKKITLDEAKTILQANLEKEANYTSCHLVTVISDVNIDIDDALLTSMGMTKAQFEEQLKSQAGEKDDTNVETYKLTIEDFNLMPADTKFYKDGNKLKIEAEETMSQNGITQKVEYSYIINEYGYSVESNEYVVSQADESLGVKYNVSAKSKTTITYNR